MEENCGMSFTGQLEMAVNITLIHHPSIHPSTHHMFHLAASFLEVSLMDLSTAGASPNLLFMGIEWNMSQYWALSGFTSVHVVSCSYRLHYAYTSIAAACATRQTGLNLQYVMTFILHSFKSVENYTGSVIMSIQQSQNDIWIIKDWNEEAQRGK